MSQVSDTLILDLDKQLTFDSARLEYQHASSILFLDIDELLFPINPSATPLQQIEEYYRTGPKDFENWRIRRSNVAGTTKSLKLQPDSADSRGLIPEIEACLRDGESPSLSHLHLMILSSSTVLPSTQCHQDAALLFRTNNNSNFPKIPRHPLRLPLLLESLLLHRRLRWEDPLDTRAHHRQNDQEGLDQVCLHLLPSSLICCSCYCKNPKRLTNA
jgi:hypothetical protein